MGKVDPKVDSRLIKKKSPWMAATIIVWLTLAGIAGVVAVFVWAAVDSRQIKQVRQLRQEMDSLVDRSYQLQHKIDSLDRLGVADFQPEDSVATKLDVPDSNRP
jgi:sensor domain CHASE-containing protein